MELRTLLYVEDSPLDVELTQEVLKENNILNPVVVADDGVEALEYLRGDGQYKDGIPGNPGMILLDLKMPRMDGLEFLAIVKKGEKYKRIPLEYDLGVNAYVVKSVDFGSFVDIVKQIGVFGAIINELPSEWSWKYEPKPR